MGRRPGPAGNKWCGDHPHSPMTPTKLPFLPVTITTQARKWNIQLKYGQTVMRFEGKCPFYRACRRSPPFRAGEEGPPLSWGGGAQGRVSGVGVQDGLPGGMPQHPTADIELPEGLRRSSHSTTSVYRRGNQKDDKPRIASHGIREEWDQGLPRELGARKRHGLQRGVGVEREGI